MRVAFISEVMWLSYWGSPVDTPQNKRMSRRSFRQFNLKGTINSKQIFMHSLQFWTHPLGICKISKKNIQTSLLKNVWHAGTSMCCQCWSTMIGNYLFSKCICKRFHAVFYSALYNWSFHYVVLIKGAFYAYANTFVFTVCQRAYLWALKQLWN
jgi:hypothetical protein